MSKSLLSILALVVSLTSLAIVLNTSRRVKTDEQTKARKCVDLKGATSIQYGPAGPKAINRNVVRVRLTPEQAKIVYKIAASANDAMGIVAFELYGVKVKNGTRIRTLLRGGHTIDDHKVVNHNDVFDERRLSYNWNRELKRLWVEGVIYEPRDTFDVHVVAYENDEEIEIPKLTGAELAIICAKWGDPE